MRTITKNPYVWIITGEGLYRADVYFNCDSMVLLSKSASLVYFCPDLSVDIQNSQVYTDDALLKMGFEKLEIRNHEK